MNRKERKQLTELEKLISEQVPVPIDENKVARERLKSTLYQLADNLTEILAPKHLTVEANKAMVDLYTPTTLAAKIGVPRNTLAQWRMQGRGPKFFKEGSLVFYRADEVANWIDDKKLYQSSTEQWNNG